MPRLLVGTAVACLVVFNLLVWARGIVRGNRGDLLAGAGLLLLLAVGRFHLVGESGACSDVGVLFLLFGLTTLAAGRFARPARRDTDAVAALCIVLGLCGLVML